MLDFSKSDKPPNSFFMGLEFSFWSFYPESSVKFHHHVCEVDSLSAANKLSNLWMIIGPDVITHKVPVDAVSAALLLVQQDVRGWNQKIPW